MPDDAGVVQVMRLSASDAGYSPVKIGHLTNSGVMGKWGNLLYAALHTFMELLLFNPEKVQQVRPAA